MLDPQKLKKDGAFNTLMQVFGNDGKEALAALKLAQKLQPAGRWGSLVFTDMQLNKASLLLAASCAHGYCAAMLRCCFPCNNMVYFYI